MKNYSLLALYFGTLLLVFACGKSDIPSLTPFLRPAPSTVLQVQPPGTSLAKGKKNYVDFPAFTHGTASQDLSYVATAARSLQVFIYGSSANVECDLSSVQTFAEWTPKDGSATRVNTGNAISTGDNYNVKKGVSYRFRFIAIAPASCQYANFTFAVLTP